MFQPVNAGPFTITSVAAAVAANGQATYTGTITGGAANAFAGYTFLITGLTVNNGINNGTWVCVASTGTTLVLLNSNAVVENGNGTANGAILLQETGPFVPASTFSYPNVGGQPQPTGLIVVHGAPKGASLEPRNYINGFNFVNTITSTQEMLSGVLKVESAQQGTAAINSAISFNSGVNTANIQTFKWS